MLFVYYVSAGLLMYLSYKSLRGGFDYLNYFKKELAKPRSDFSPFATIFAPCKGLDEGLEANLAALFAQDYPIYEVIFVVDDPEDPSVKVIEEVSRSVGPKSKLVVAQTATDSSQKVENLREAVLHVDERSQVYVFVDSDVRPSSSWLQGLVAAVEDDKVGAATGYRWFISRTPSFASELRSIWNASIASALGPNTKDNFCWAGSMAIRRDTFEKLEIRERWQGALSDDFAVTRAMNASGLAIVFVPIALTASVEDCTLGRLLDFTTRQMKITRVYAQRLWLMSFLGSALFCTVMLAALFVIIVGRENGVQVWASILVLFAVLLMGTCKSWIRSAAVRMAMPKYELDLKKQRLMQLSLWPITPLIFLCNSVAALLSRRMTWRGIRYEMVSPSETRVINYT